MTEENPTPQGDQTSETTSQPTTSSQDNSQADNLRSQSEAEGVLSGGSKGEQKPWAEQFPNDKDGSEVWKAYTELRKKLSAGEHKKQAAPDADSKPAKAEGNWSTEKEQKLKRYEVEEQRQAINKELGLDFDTGKWREVADFVAKTKTPKQIKAIEAAIDAGLYTVVRDLVEEFKGSQTGDEPSAGDTPKRAISGDPDSEGPYVSREDMLEGLRQARKTGNFKRYEKRLSQTPPRIKESFSVR